LVVFYPSFYVVLKNWNRKCFWTVFTSCEMVYYGYLCIQDPEEDPWWADSGVFD